MHWQANQQFLTQLTLIFKRLLGKVDKGVQHRKWICVKMLKNGEEQTGISLGFK